MTKSCIEEDQIPPQTPVSLVAIGDCGEALLIRAILENMNALVTTHFIGKPTDFLRVVSGEYGAPRYLVISAHGNSDGIDISALKDGSMPAFSLNGIVRLPGTVVFSTACTSGRPEFANTFLSGGASTYIATDDFPDGSDVPLILHMLFHQLLHLGHDLGASWQHTVEHVEAARSFTMFSSTVV